ncbi:CLUMA_CG002081, isoform A [Clunio marinus]|uniref:CLUMA_CG002081, isoform A n=1 Tax=Clunio marinus TaxID=568069 RepID=A0A1J1HP99_9DIPT|nr:CLUMA_CG002081, isoform A [Clunio marinus]
MFVVKYSLSFFQIKNEREHFGEDVDKTFIDVYELMMISEQELLSIFPSRFQKEKRNAKRKI